MLKQNKNALLAALEGAIYVSSRKQISSLGFGREPVCVYNRPKRSNRGRPADLWAPAAGHLWTSACVPASYHDECDGNPTGFSSQSSRETTNIYNKSHESLI